MRFHCKIHKFVFRSKFVAEMDSFACKEDKTHTETNRVNAGKIFVFFFFFFIFFTWIISYATSIRCENKEVERRVKMLMKINFK